MSTCHQAHNIPWNTFLELLHKIPPRYNPSNLPVDPGIHSLVFTPDEEGRVSRKVKFFANKVHLAIKEFSSTERKKYADKDIDGLSQIFGDESLNEWLTKGLQDLSGWKGLIEASNNHHYLEPVKELFNQEKAISLMHLARKGARFEDLVFVTYSNFFHYGIGRIKEDCLTLYIHLNLLLATGTICKPNQWYEQWRRFRQGEILGLYDGNSQARMYKEYFDNNPNFEDLEGLQNLLKRLFRLLYLYDMVMMERGRNINWEEEVLRCVGSYFVDTTAYKYFSLWCKQVGN